MGKNQESKQKMETKDNCYYYSWGGDIGKGFPTYPSAYGAMCMFSTESFSSEEGPNCEECGKFIEDEEMGKLLLKFLLKKDKSEFFRGLLREIPKLNPEELAEFLKTVKGRAQKASK